MIPYLLAAVGGYLIGQSRKQDVFADGGMIFKKGERVLLKDGGGQRIATIVQDGYDSKNRVRVRPEGFPMDLSIPMEEKYSDDKRLYIIRKMAEGGEMAKGGEIADIDKMKKSLIQKAKSKGLYENFGQKEVRQLEDKYGYTPAVQKFDEWAMNFDLSQMADGGVLAHGLREDDKIYVERGNLAGIKNDKTDEKFIVDISTGSREKLKD